MTGVYEVIDGIAKLLRKILPKSLIVNTFIPETEEQLNDIQSDCLFIVLDNVSIDYKARNNGEQVAEIVFGAEAFSLDPSSSIAEKQAYTVLETIRLYLAYHENEINVYLAEQGFTSVSFGNILVKNDGNNFGGGASFKMVILRNFEISKSMTDISSITKRLYDITHGLFEEHTVE